MPILAKETDLFPEDLFERAAYELSAAQDPSDVYAPRWWAVYTRSRHEKALTRRLLAMEVPFYAPVIERRYRSPKGRIRTTYAPLFPNYVFIFGNGEQRYAAMTSNCVSRYCEVQAGERLNRDLANIHRLIQTGAPLTPEESVSPGDRVRVKTGPFSGFEGVVVRRHGETRLLVVVDFMQQGASVLLDDCQIEVLDRTRNGHSPQLDCKRN